MLNISNSIILLLRMFILNLTLPIWRSIWILDYIPPSLIYSLTCKTYTYYPAITHPHNSLKYKYTIQDTQVCTTISIKYTKGTKNEEIGSRDIYNASHIPSKGQHENIYYNKTIPKFHLDHYELSTHITPHTWSALNPTYSTWLEC